MNAQLRLLKQNPSRGLKSPLRGLIASAALVGIGLLPLGSWAAGEVTFTQNPVSTTTNIGAWALDSTATGYNPGVDNPGNDNDDPAHGFTVLGENLNNNDLPKNEPVMQVVADQLVQIGGGGQSFFFAYDTASPVSQIIITPTGPLAYFSTVEFNPLIDHLPTSCSVSTPCSFTLTATYAFIDDLANPFADVTSNPFAMTSGENRVAAVAAADYGITQLVVDMTPGMNDFKEFRINYLLCTNPDGCGGSSGPVDELPEPSDMSLMGIGLAALLGIRRKRTAA